MLRLLALSLLTSASIFAFTPAAFAEDPAPAAEEQSAEEQAEKEQEIEKMMQDQAIIKKEDPEVSPAMQKLSDDMRAITKDMSKTDRRHFFMIYNNHNMISTVKYVKDKVSEAIDACSKENPDMEQALRDRFKIWTDAVGSHMSEAEAFRDNMVEVQEYADKSKVKSVMRQADDLRAETNKKIKTIPVTSKEACEHLLNKMDETQDRMLSILRTTLVTLPKALQNLPTEDE